MATILLIEDDDVERAATTQMLAQEGHEVETLPDGRRALERCRSRSFDVVITDLIMPEQEGIETIQRLRQAKLDVCIIAISDEGHHAQGSRYLHTASLLGADETFVKPLNPEQLHECIHRLVLDKDASSLPPSSRFRSTEAPRLSYIGSAPEQKETSREERPPLTARHCLSPRRES